MPVSHFSAHEKDLGDGFIVRRALPQAMRKMVGPFIFLDQMGPVSLPAGHVGVNVRPHPHIGLSTVTFLFEGTIWHKDSLGTSQDIFPGDVNWMTAGEGIVHSERSRPEVVAAGQRVHGMQAWVALPVEHETCAPSFVHHPQETLPRFTREQDGDDADIVIIVGTAFGRTSPVQSASETLYLDVRLRGALTLPASLSPERAVYVVDGAVQVAGQRYDVGSLLVLEGDERVEAVDGAAHVMVLGGAPFPEKRLIEWNFVASTPALLDAARERWRAEAFPLVPGDEEERIPY